jgi:hypothetical protein
VPKDRKPTDDDFD